MEIPLRFYGEIILFLIIPTGILLYGAIKLKQSINTIPGILILIGSILLVADSEVLTSILGGIVIYYFPSEDYINFFMYERYLAYTANIVSFILLGIGLAKLSTQLRKMNKLTDKEKT